MSHRVVVRCVVPSFVIYYTAEVEVTEAGIEYSLAWNFWDREAVLQAITEASKGSCEWPWGYTGDTEETLIEDAEAIPEAEREWLDYIPFCPEGSELDTVKGIIGSYPRELRDAFVQERKKK